MFHFGGPFIRSGFLALLLAPAPSWAVPAERSFGIVPQQSPSTLAQLWQPILDCLSDRSGPSLRFATATTIAQFEERALAGTYDYLYTNPLLFRQLRVKTGYRALVRDTQPSTGIIVVRNDGPKTLAELGNRTIAFPAARALAATLLTRADLKRLDIPHGAVYLGNHDSAYRAVIQGQYPAAGGVQRTFELLPAELRSQLRILHTAKPLIAHLIAVHPRVPAAEVQRLRHKLMQLDDTPKTLALLTQLGMHQLIPVTTTDIESFETMAFSDRPARLRFHVIPRLDETVTRQHMLPLAAYLRQRLDIDVELRTYSSMDRFQAAISRETRPSLVNANPIQALALSRRGYHVIAQQLATAKDGGMRSLIVVRSDSRYHSLADLNGRRVAFGSGRDAFFTDVVPRAMLRRAGLQGKYVDASRPGPLADVFPRLRDGDIDAAATGSLSWQNTGLQEQYIRGHMRILAQSELLPGLGWLIGPNVDPDLRNDLQTLLVNFHTDAPGKAAMRAAGIERLKVAGNATYASVAPYLTVPSP